MGGFALKVKGHVFACLPRLILLIRIMIPICTTILIVYASATVLVHNKIKLTDRSTSGRTSIRYYFTVESPLKYLPYIIGFAKRAEARH